MPVSPSQHRASVGNYQYQLYKKKWGNISYSTGTNQDHSNIPDEIGHFTSQIIRSGNSTGVLNTPTGRCRARQSAVTTAVQFMLLLNQMQSVNNPPLAINSSPPILPEKGITPSFFVYTLQSDLSYNGSSAILSSVTNALYKAVEFISQQDPLRLPGAEALHLSENPDVGGKGHKKVIIEDIDGKVVDLNRNYNDVNIKNEHFKFIKAGQEALAKFYEKYTLDYPGLKSLASTLLTEKIKQRFNLNIDPDKVDLICFNANGDLGNGPERDDPVEKKTLTEWLFSNFNSDMQIDLPGVHYKCGVYDSAHKNNGIYYVAEQLNIPADEFVKLVWDMDFYNYAKKKITENFEHKDAHSKKYFIDFINHINIANINVDSAEDVLNGAGILKSNDVAVTLFDINRYTASNAYIFKNKNGRVTLYFPKSDFKFISFRGVFEMRSWVTNACSTKEHRDMIASHFTRVNRHDGIFYYGVDAWLESINQNNDYYDKIAIKSTQVPSDHFFEFFYDRIKDKTLSDLDSLIKSDAEVKRDMWEDMIDASNIIPNPVSPFLSLGIHLEHAIDADSYEEKMNEWNKIKDDIINLVIMVVLDKAIKFPDTEGYSFINKVTEGTERWRTEPGLVKNNMDSEVIPLKRDERFHPEIMQEVDDKKILFAKEIKYSAKNARSLVLRFAIHAESYEKITEIKDYDFYRVKKLNGEVIKCLKMDGKFIPVRALNRKVIGYEIYDYNNVNKPGYPVFLDLNNEWNFGMRFDPSMKGDATLNPFPYISNYLHRSIPPYFYIKDLRFSKFEPIDDRGIIKKQDGTNYLSLQDGYVEIKTHPNLPDTFELGPDNVEKILCYYDRGSHKFLAYQEESSISEHNEMDEDTKPGEAYYNEKSIVKFSEQKIMSSYREGFRTQKFDDYKIIALLDSRVEKIIQEIYLYGLNDEEISQAGSYKQTAQEIRRDVINAQDVVTKVKQHLLNAEHDSRVRDHFYNMFGVVVNSEEAQNILRLFINKIDETHKIIEQYISDDFRRIWLVRYREKGIYGMTFTNDPLKRMFINLEKSDAYRRYQGKVACSCSHVVSDKGDMSTIIHEASHSGANTEDFFYMHKTSIDKEIERLGSGDMTEEEIKAILVSDAVPDIPASPSEAKELAVHFFNNYPYIRAKFLMKNADSFTQIILELFDKSAGISKRDTLFTKDINVEMLCVFVNLIVDRERIRNSESDINTTASSKFTASHYFATSLSAR